MMIGAIAALTLLGLTLGFALGMAGRYLKVEENPLAAEIEQLLPGTNCGQCGFPGCSAGAEKIANGEAPLTFCPPGGRVLAETLSARLNIPLDLSGLEESEPLMATIREEICIGCTKCIKLCPTDAIIGAPKQIHAVMLRACTGCSKCIEVCPTGSLAMEPIPVTLPEWRWPRPLLAAA